MLAIQNDREWQRFCVDVLGDADLAADDRFATGSARVEHRPDLLAAIDAVFSTLTGDEVVARLEAADIANGRRRTLDEVLAHPQHAARDRWGEVATPAGPVRAFVPPITLPGRSPRMDPVPDVGEHTDAVLAEFA